MEVQRHLYAVFARHGQHDGLHVVEPAVQPAVVFVQVLVRPDAVPVAHHLVAQERRPPRGERREVVLRHVAARWGHHAAERCAVCGVDAPVGRVCDGPDRGQRADPEGGKVEHDLAGGSLDAEVERSGAFGAPEPAHLPERDVAPVERLQRRAALRVAHGAGLAVLPAQHELEAQPRLRRLRDALAARHDMGLEAGSLPRRKVDLRPRPLCLRVEALWNRDREQVAVDAASGRKPPGAPAVLHDAVLRGGKRRHRQCHRGKRRFHGVRAHAVASGCVTGHRPGRQDGRPRCCSARW